MKFAVFSLALCLAVNLCYGSDGSEEAITPDDFAAEIAALVGRVKGLDDELSTMISAAKDFVSNTNPTPGDFEALAQPYEALAQEAEAMFDDVASSLVDLGRALYENAEGFQTSYHCGNFENIVTDAADPDKRKNLVADFLVDLECFKNAFGAVDHIDTSSLAFYSENNAIELVAEFLKHLTIGKRNAFKFAEAVEEAIDELFAGEAASTAPTTPAVRSQERALRMLLDALRQKGLGKAR